MNPIMMNLVRNLDGFLAFLIRLFGKIIGLLIILISLISLISVIAFIPIATIFMITHW